MVDAEQYSVYHNDPDFMNVFSAADFLSGRRIVFRPDITPQVARMDSLLCATKLKPRRLCYVAPVFYARTNELIDSRSQLQAGAELFGVSDQSADLEIIVLSYRLLQKAGGKNISVVLGDVSFFKTLIEPYLSKLPQDLFRKVLAIICRKSHTDAESFCSAHKLSPTLKKNIHFLLDAHGSSSAVVALLKKLPSYKKVAETTKTVNSLRLAIEKKIPGLSVILDLGMVDTYDYKTGVLFSHYLQGYNSAVVRGGRYDGMEHHNGKPRSATGFSMSLDRLAARRAHHNQ